MKYVVFLGDGMSDLAMDQLHGQTPLMAAHTPNLDRMVRLGIGGWSRNTPAGFYPGSDVANLGVLGYDVRNSYTGRSPLEAVAMGVELESQDVAFRCNLVTLSGDGLVMEDFSAGHISSQEAFELIQTLNQTLGSDQFRFYPGVSYRQLMVWKNGRHDLHCTPPHDISDQAIADHLPNGVDALPIRQIMQDARAVLADHPINHKRINAGLKPANSIWLWGHGRKPVLDSFQSCHGKKGGMISAVDLMRGIALHIGLRVVPVPGATGWIDTNYEGKAQACLEALKTLDLMFIHVESPDEAGHAGRLDYKIQAIQDFDAKIIGPVLSALESSGTEFRAIALPDHPTPVALRTHTPDPVPFALYGQGIQPDANLTYDETLLNTGSLNFDPGFGLMRYFLGN